VSDVMVDQQTELAANKQDNIECQMEVDAQWKDLNDDEQPVPVDAALMYARAPQDPAIIQQVLEHQRSIKCEHQIKDPESDCDTSSVKAQAGSPGRQKQPTSSASLERYIREASRLPKGSTIFARVPGVQEPTLERHRSNRVLVFKGCFNPPHRGHRELLLHTYLCTDSKTIAAIVAPRDDDDLDPKYLQQSLTFTEQQRKQLWQDDILQPFTWIYPGSQRDINDLVKRMKTIARMDGFSLSFTTMKGSDHIDLAEEPSWSGGTGSRITSDITRASKLIAKDDDKPHPVIGYKQWRKILPARSVQRPDGVNACWPCWPCWKLSKIYPQFKGMHANTGYLPDDLHDILQRCHQGRGILWSASHPAGGILWFLPSGRRYPADERRPSVSSTMVRKLVANYDGDHDALHESLRQLVFNPGRLIILRGLNKCWLARDDGRVTNWERKSVSEKADDDWAVGVREHQFSMKRKNGQDRRRNSI
jgi:hypothetical protein